MSPTPDHHIPARRLAASSPTRVALLALSLAFLPPAAIPQTPAAPPPGEPIAAGLAEDRVEVKVNYSGARIVLFATSPFGEDPATGFAVALIGPSAPQTVIRRTAGGAQSFEFVSAPTVFAIGAEPSVVETTTPETMVSAGLNASSSAMPAPENLLSPDLAAWRAAFVDLKMEQQLYSLDETTIERLEGGLRRARINLPANAPPGQYRVRAVASRMAAPSGKQRKSSPWCEAAWTPRCTTWRKATASSTACWRC